jgi:predicted AAA+ superfamily ATPase
MHKLVPRRIEPEVARGLGRSPVVALLGPRQCGKSTLARQVIARVPRSVYLDLERPAHANRLNDPELFFESTRGRLVCLDEIQRKPDLFPIMKSIVDERGANGQFLVLGSASPELLRQGSETLAGRLAFLNLTPFLVVEETDARRADIRVPWLRGGFPRSRLAGGDGDSFAWRQDFIATFLERDVPQLGFRIPAVSLRRFWLMCAHVHGQVFNASRLGESLGVSHHTVRSWLDILERTFLVRVLPPLEANLKKRLVKSPKIYIRDSGILHALLGIPSLDDLLGNPACGHSWEGFVVENVLALATGWRASFYRTATGEEMDLVLEKGKRRIALECKVSSSPQVSRGMKTAIADLGITQTMIVAPVAEAYPLERGITVTPLRSALEQLFGA